MPINGLTESVRLPRLGKIRLGLRHPEKGYPMKTDYFVLPKDNPDYDRIVELYGEKPKELPILIPVEDEEVWATQYYRAYNMTYGLICKGDGEAATRMVYADTEELPSANKGGTVKIIERECQGRECPEYQTKKCHEVMNLRFVLPEVPGLGIWQIDTGSKNSILNINSCARMIKQAFGRISLIPLKLTFEPVQVNEPDTGKKQTVYVLNLRTDVTIAELADVARKQTKLLSVATLENAFDIAIQEDIETLWPEDKKAEVLPELREVEYVNDELWPDGEVTPPHVPQTESALLDWVCEWREFSSTKTARAWLVNECHYAPEKIAKDPAGIYTELVERV